MIYWQINRKNERIYLWLVKEQYIEDLTFLYVINKMLENNNKSKIYNGKI